MPLSPAPLDVRLRSLHLMRDAAVHASGAEDGVEPDAGPLRSCSVARPLWGRCSAPRLYGLGARDLAGDIRDAEGGEQPEEYVLAKDVAGLQRSLDRGHARLESGFGRPS